MACRTGLASQERISLGRGVGPQRSSRGGSAALRGGAACVHRVFTGASVCGVSCGVFGSGSASCWPRGVRNRSPGRAWVSLRTGAASFGCSVPGLPRGTGADRPGLLARRGSAQTVCRCVLVSVGVVFLGICVSSRLSNSGVYGGSQHTLYFSGIGSSVPTFISDFSNLSLLSFFPESI